MTPLRGQSTCGISFLSRVPETRHYVDTRSPGAHSTNRTLASAHYTMYFFLVHRWLLLKFLIFEPTPGVRWFSPMLPPYFICACAIVATNQHPHISPRDLPTRLPATAASLPTGGSPSKPSVSQQPSEPPCPAPRLRPISIRRPTNLAKSAPWFPVPTR